MASTRAVRHALPLGLVATILLAPSGPAAGQAAGSPRGRVAPAIPGAVERPPGWLLGDRGVPFDPKAFLALPPAGQNAAPVYLDALFEFADDVAGCFPDGPTTRARARRAAERGKRLVPLLQAAAPGGERVDRGALSALLPEFREGFAKLAQAQKRPRCAFAIGIDLAAPVPHASAARRVTQVSTLAILPRLDAGELDGPIGYAAVNLRLARDLQPRGPAISQFVSAALVNTTVESIVRPILRHPKVTTAQCDRLIGLLTDHESRSIDGYGEALKAEYLLARATLRDLSAGDGPKRAAILGALAGHPGGNLQGESTGETLEAALSRAAPRDFDRAVAGLNGLIRDALATAKLPPARRAARFASAAQKLPRTTGPERMIGMLVAPLAMLGETAARGETAIRAAQALAAVRRWQVVHKAVPADLAAACREAKLPGVPRDPYAADGQALRYVVLDGEPVVYSVGKDGRDDGGRRDNRANTQAGDLTFRLTPRS